jgi:AraC family transcriptional regulator
MLRLERGGDFSSTHTVATTPHATFAECTYAASNAAPRHGHASPYFGLVLRGAFEERYGAKCFDFGRGSLAYHPAEAEHATRFERVETTVFRIEPSREFMQRDLIAEALPPSPARIVNPRTIDLARRLRDEFIRPECHSAIVTEGLLLELVGCGARDAGEPREQPAPPWLRRVLEQIEESYAEPLSVASLARSAGVHPAHLGRVFRAHKRLSVGEYVRRMRVRASCVRLRNSDEPIVDIALALGFCDQSHFANAFRRELGMTARHYRLTHRRR